jgi:hypothetical protein
MGSTALVEAPAHGMLAPTEQQFFLHVSYWYHYHQRNLPWATMVSYYGL